MLALLAQMWCPTISAKHARQLRTLRAEEDRADTSAAVHKSSMDFLGQAEAVYFARKKKKADALDAKKPGAYGKSGGRVFPTEQNSGLKGEELRQEQERFFERGLSEGKDPGELRGQVAESGLKRVGGLGRPEDRIVDPEVEATLQSAIGKSKK